MAHIASQITIQRSKEDLWNILSNLTAMQQYMPGIKEVRFTSDERQGVGAARHCTFNDGVQLFEEVVAWNPGQGYTLKTTQFVKVPMKENDITFSLQSDGDNTIVTQSMDYQMKGGIFAPIMAILAKGMMKKALDGALTGLKAFAENQTIPEKS